MNEIYFARLAAELQIHERQVAATAHLLGEGATVPFIARYRKEVTGQLDEVVITAVRDRLAALVELDARREAIRKSLVERNLLTEALKAGIDQADSLTALEDLYAPYRPKRRTRAMIAQEAGLGPLAEILFAQVPTTDPAAEAARFIAPDKGVADANAALAGARDIVAERVSDDATARGQLRELYRTQATVRSKVLTEKQTEGAKYKDYFEWSEPVATIPSHRLLAIRRGETEGVLLCRINPPEEAALALLEPLFVRGASPVAEQVRLAVKDAYKRLLGFALEAELRMESKKKADAEAIRVFADNLREVELGIIKKADTIAGLAQHLGVDAAILEATVARWNESCARNKDEEFGRPSGTMMPLDTPPYYVGDLYPMVSNTQGGPVHNARQQVIDVFNAPISRLYSAGELGSGFGFLYLSGGNLSECIVGGGIAGRGAAALSPWD